MSDEPLTNAAVESARRSHAVWNSRAQAPTTHRLADDFIMEDRRRSGGINFGQLDATDWYSMIASTWDVGSGRPHFSIPEVIAVRGHSCACVIIVVDFGNDMHTSFVNSFQYGGRMVLFDLDARDEAIAELDRMHAEIDD